MVHTALNPLSCQEGEPVLNQERSIDTVNTLEVLTNQLLSRIAIPALVFLIAAHQHQHQHHHHHINMISPLIHFPELRAVDLEVSLCQVGQHPLEARTRRG